MREHGPLPLPLRVAQLKKDIGFNQNGAVNTGAKEAHGPFLLMLDVDHWLAPEVMSLLVRPVTVCTP